MKICRLIKPFFPLKFWHRWRKKSSMDQASCRNAWLEAGDHEKAAKLDQAFPDCVCEIHSLQAIGGDGIKSDELVARVFTDPASYIRSTEMIVGGSVTSVYSGGLSIIRQGASDEEILATINVLLAQHEAQNLVGAAVTVADNFRVLGSPDKWFGVYATDDDNKQHHADLLGTIPSGTTNGINKLKSHRRAELRKVLTQHLVFESDPVILLQRLREIGI